MAIRYAGKMKRTYFGSCHCGQVKFEIHADIDHVRVCDCSICFKRGALIYRVEKENFQLLSSWDELVTYQWKTMTAKDYFCMVCGILPFRKPSDLTQAEIERGMEPFYGWAVNIRCLDDLDISKIPVINIQGRKL